MTFQLLGNQDSFQRQSVLNQLVDVVQEDVSGSATRRKYQVFVTGGIGPGVTSSLFQTVYDQDFTLQTANPILDISVGLFTGSMTVTGSRLGGFAPQRDAAGKWLFASNSLMMREKLDSYQQFAARLLGDPYAPFITPFGFNGNEGLSLTNETHVNDNMVGEAIFLSFKRLFSRDAVKSETFAMRWYDKLNPLNVSTVNGAALPTPANNAGPGNLMQTSSGSVRIITDFGAASTIQDSPGGKVGNLYFSDATDTATGKEEVGLIFYNAGIIVLNARKACAGNQAIMGTVNAMRSGATTPGGTATLWQNGDIPDGKTVMGVPFMRGDPGVNAGTAPVGGAQPAERATLSNSGARFVPDFFYSGSVDNIIDHIASCRFSSGSLTAMTFQNNTEINSTIYMCRAPAGAYNFSTNPTFTDDNHNIVVIPAGDDSGLERSFTFITTVGLYDAQDQLLAVGKLSRPVEKNDEKDLTIRVRLDY